MFWLGSFEKDRTPLRVLFPLKLAFFCSQGGFTRRSRARLARQRSSGKLSCDDASLQINLNRIKVLFLYFPSSRVFRARSHPSSESKLGFWIFRGFSARDTAPVTGISFYSVGLKAENEKWAVKTCVGREADSYGWLRIEWHHFTIISNRCLWFCFIIFQLIATHIARISSPVWCVVAEGTAFEPSVALYHVAPGYALTPQPLIYATFPFVPLKNNQTQQPAQTGLGTQWVNNNDNNNQNNYNIPNNNNVFLTAPFWSSSLLYTVET